jgi:type IV pilus secretin PilQ/predicted competence protein
MTHKAALEDLSQLITRQQKVYYADAKKVAELITANNAMLLSSRGKASYNADNNTVILLDIPSKIQPMLDFIAKIDTPAKQVIIETYIVKTSEDLKQALGIKYPAGNNGANIGGTLNNSKLTLDLAPNNHTIAANLALSKLSRGLLLDLELQALEKEQRLTILASPKILTLDKKTAIIESGQEIPYVTKNRAGADPQVIFKKATLKLEVTPLVTPNNDILLQLKINRDQPGIQVPGILQAPIETTQIITDIIAKHGETIMLGGIFSEQESKAVSKIPIIERIPIIGDIFSNHERNHDKQEMVVFVTPKICDL